MRPLVNGRRHHRRGEFHGVPLPVPLGTPLRIQAELHYLYALLIFSDAEPTRFGYTPATGCARIEYQRDGKPWVMTIRR